MLPLELSFSLPPCELVLCRPERGTDSELVMLCVQLLPSHFAVYSPMDLTLANGSIDASTLLALPNHFSLGVMPSIVLARLDRREGTPDQLVLETADTHPLPDRDLDRKLLGTFAVDAGRILGEESDHVGPEESTPVLLRTAPARGSRWGLRWAVGGLRPRPPTPAVWLWLRFGGGAVFPRSLGDPDSEQSEPEGLVMLRETLGQRDASCGGVRACSTRLLLKVDSGLGTVGEASGLMGDSWGLT